VSGIAGVIHFDGRPAVAVEIEPMLRELGRRGPDGRDAHVHGSAVLGTTLLRVASDRPDNPGPLTFDGNTWIVCDARLDGIEELLRKLRDAGRTVAADAGAAELVLHAFHAWGRAALERLLGDFSFAIWQARERRLVCARDHFGIRPFFWWPSGDGFRFANSLKALEVSRAQLPPLNEKWIGDFLLFGESLSPEPTIWSGIRRLPAAHVLEATAEKIEVRPYWKLQADAPLQYRRADEYVERFSELLEQATADRLHADAIAVEMSGGLDSTSVAAVAARLMKRQCSTSRLWAYTMVTESLTPDPERAYAELAAQAIGLPWQFFDSDRHGLFENFTAIASEQGEPWHEITCAFKIDMTREVAAQTRVVLTGWDGDAWLSESPTSRLRAIVRSIRSMLRPRRPASEHYPRWLQADFEQRAHLREHWLARQRVPKAAAHPLRPYAFGAWDYLLRTSNHFEAFDTAFHLQPLEYRHPLMDKRLVEFCVALPMPWCVDKQVLRRAMDEELPRAVVERPKTPQGGAWTAALMARDAPAFFRGFVPGRGVSGFVDCDAYRLNWHEGSADATARATWSDMRVATLDMWLRSRFD